MKAPFLAISFSLDPVNARARVLMWVGLAAYLLTVIVLLWPSTALGQHIPGPDHEVCLARSKMQKSLKDEHHQRVTGYTKGTTSGMIQLWESAAGQTWTIVTILNGESCIRAAGENWTSVRDK